MVLVTLIATFVHRNYIKSQRFNNKSLYFAVIKFGGHEHLANALGVPFLPDAINQKAPTFSLQSLLLSLLHFAHIMVPHDDVYITHEFLTSTHRRRPLWSSRKWRISIPIHQDPTCLLEVPRFISSAILKQRLVNFQLNQISAHLFFLH